MGFNTNGVVVGGGESVRTAAEGDLIHGVFNSRIRVAIIQTEKVVTTRVAGTSLDNCQQQHASLNGDGSYRVYGTDKDGVVTEVVAPGVSGNETRISYSRIGDSNLFDLTVENVTKTAYHSHSNQTGTQNHNTSL